MNKIAPYAIVVNEVDFSLNIHVPVLVRSCGNIDEAFKIFQLFSNRYGIKRLSRHDIQHVRYSRNSKYVIHFVSHIE